MIYSTYNVPAIQALTKLYFIKIRYFFTKPHGAGDNLSDWLHHCTWLRNKTNTLYTIYISSADANPSTEEKEKKVIYSAL